MQLLCAGVIGRNVFLETERGYGLYFPLTKSRVIMCEPGDVDQLRADMQGFYEAPRRDNVLEFRP